jgi:transcription elongation GreA/GreB family factor
MENVKSWRELPEGELEDWFLGRLPENKANFADLLDLIGHFAANQQLERAEACAGLLMEALKKDHAVDELLILLERRAGWQTDHKAYAALCAETLAGFFPAQSNQQLFLAAAGLQTGVPPVEALRRLRVLCALTPGRCCYKKALGLGTVAGIDQFEHKFVINFENGQVHRLAFSYAAESVQPLADDSFLALKLREPEKFRTWLAEKPSEAVKETIRHFGEMNLQGLRALMTGLMLPEKGWTGFWSNARAKLSSDPLVAMPAGRNDPLRLLSGAKTFDENWRAEFGGLNDVERILSGLEELLRHFVPAKPPAEFKPVVEDRLKFVLRGLAADRHEIIARALLLAAGAGIPGEGLFDISAYSNPDLLASALNAFPARLVGPFLEFLESRAPGGMDLVLRALPQLAGAALSEAIAVCRKQAGEEKFFALLRALIQKRTTSIEMFGWMVRNLPLILEKQVGGPDVLAKTGLDLLQSALTGGSRKDANQLLRQVFKNESLLKTMLGAMDAEQRLDFSRRLAQLSGLSAADRHVLTGKIIIMFPELAGAFNGPAVAVSAPKLTSWRSYRARQAQLAKIINDDIPRNSKEIGEASSYGDLRENYEYKAARERQGLLMRRKAEYEKMLGEVRGTDFAGIKPEAAGPGVSVVLKMPAGDNQTYHILGEWDSDEALGIISCSSRLAETLHGRRAGETVTIPGEKSPIKCLITAVCELPPEIKAWLNA